MTKGSEGRTAARKRVPKNVKTVEYANRANALVQLDLLGLHARIHHADRKINAMAMASASPESAVARTRSRDLSVTKKSFRVKTTAT